MLYSRCFKTFSWIYNVAGTTSRTIHTTSVNKSRSLEKFKKLQAKFQVDDGKPVYLKGGFMDRLLFSITIVLCYIGLFNNVLVIYGRAKPISWRK